MATATVIKKRTKEQMLQTLIKEVKRLQFQVWLLSLPEEDINEYDDPEEIEAAYQRAIKQYPPEDMTITKTADFIRALSKLPDDIRQLVNQQEIRFSEDPADPRLHLKKLKGKSYYSLRVTRAYRVLLYFEDENTASWFKISHRKDVYK